MSEIEILKRYIRKMIRESSVLDVSSTGDTSLEFELQKPNNKGIPITSDEFNQIKSSIKSRDAGILTIDYDPQKLQITFEKNIDQNNFYFLIRKIVNVPRRDYKFVMWYISYKERSDIDKPGNVSRKESAPFDETTGGPTINTIINEFVKQSLLVNL